ncbi:hypothetical protein [Algihabitans sp.]|uniref:hypothetical protein n=1 Tax=Algihabitans sp. TaxID=2821514 RepID=UPI003BAB2B7A
MAKPIRSTSLSRRAMLARSFALPAAVFPAAQTFATIPTPAALTASDPGPDAELFRRIAQAKRLRKRCARAQRIRDRLRAARAAQADLPPLPWRGPFPPYADPASLQHAELFRRYAEAVRAAVALPAHTATGLHAKLSLAAVASRRGRARVYLYEDREWLETALVDLRRLAEATAPGA